MFNNFFFNYIHILTPQCVRLRARVCECECVRVRECMCVSTSEGVRVSGCECIMWARASVKEGGSVGLIAYDGVCVCV